MKSTGSEEMKEVYLDNSATTMAYRSVGELVQKVMCEDYGNPSSMHNKGVEAEKYIKEAKETFARLWKVQEKEVYFTSGGTEADNWALKGAAFCSPDRQGQIVTSSIEHHAVLHTCDSLGRLGYCIDLLPVNQDGTVAASVLEELLRENTILVSIMLANNEIGTIQPIRELAEVTHRYKSLFHTDGVQAVGHILVDVKELRVDMLSASAHKFNGPKGCGFLYIRDGIVIEPLMHGGAQEHGRRAGTENVAGIVGMATALEEHQKQLKHEMTYLCGLADILLGHLRETGLDFLVNGSSNRIPGSLSLSFRGADGEMLLHRLDLMGTAVATGSACDSKAAVLSHVIQAIGVPDDYKHGTVRITLGMDNNEKDARTIAGQIACILN